MSAAILLKWIQPKRSMNNPGTADLLMYEEVGLLGHHAAGLPKGPDAQSNCSG